MKRCAGFARTVDSLCDRLDGVVLPTLQFIQDAAAVGGRAAGCRVSQAGGRIDGDAHGILVLSPSDPGVVGDTVQGVFLDHRSTGSWTQGLSLIIYQFVLWDDFLFIVSVHQTEEHFTSTMPFFTCSYICFGEYRAVALPVPCQYSHSVVLPTLQLC